MAGEERVANFQNPELYQPNDYNLHFDPAAYLQHYYSQKATDAGGMKVMLFALPILARRIPADQKTLLDIGSGPTVYVAMCFRDCVQEIYLTDYVQSNRKELQRWLWSQEPFFNWAPVAKSISFSEGEPRNWETIENATRAKIRGILFCDVHRQDMIPETPAESKTFDIVVSIFCLESACSDHEQYSKAMANIVQSVKPGGYFILGSVIGESSYESGGPKDFHLLDLSTEQIIRAMDQAGIDVHDPSVFHIMNFDSAAVFMGQRKE